MLVTLNDILPSAREKGYAVGLFNAVNLELARGIIAAAEETGSPVIMGTAEVLFSYGPLDEVSYYLLPMAKKARVPVAVHLDHGLKRETCMRALELGFSSIMYDCSSDLYEINVSKVKEMAEIAHSYGATIEAELGHVGDNGSHGGEEEQPEKYYTDPKQAKDFVEKTNVDALAIAVGTAHGTYKLPPKLDFRRIQEIKSTVPVPLVLHGGSGLTDSDFRNAIQSGISKINIFTDINIAAVEAALRTFDSIGKGIIDLIPAAVLAVKQEVIKKLKLFGSVDRAETKRANDWKEDREALINEITARVLKEIAAADTCK